MADDDLMNDPEVKAAIERAAAKRRAVPQGKLRPREFWLEPYGAGFVVDASVRVWIGGGWITARVVSVGDDGCIVKACGRKFFARYSELGDDVGELA